MQIPLQDKKVTVWYRFKNIYFIGLFFFEEMRDSGFETTSVTGERYADMLQICIIPCLAEKTFWNARLFFKNRGPLHFSREVKGILFRLVDDDRVLSNHFRYAWPSRSPDLNSCNYWF